MLYFLGERRPKGFKLKSERLTPQDRVSIQKRHLFKEITTRAYYSGEQVIEILINGAPVQSSRFGSRFKCKQGEELFFECVLNSGLHLGDLFVC